MATPHLEASLGDIAERVLLPGDPARAKIIAETFLEDVVCYNKVRGALGFTGTYKGKRVSIQSTGMGMPSMSIYATELMEFFNIKRAIRVGTCGSINENLKIKDIVVAQATSTDSGSNHDRFGNISFAPCASIELLIKAYENAKEKNANITIGNILTSDKFYDDRMEEKVKLMSTYGVLGIDMETCELYTVAAKYNVDALGIFTVSDCILTGEKATYEQRQSSFLDMVKIALDII